MKTAESMAIEVVRKLMLTRYHDDITRLTVRVNDEVATYLNNRKRRELSELEQSTGVAIQILGSEGQFPEYLEIECYDGEDRPLNVGL